MLKCHITLNSYSKLWRKNVKFNQSIDFINSYKKIKTNKDDYMPSREEEHGNRVKGESNVGAGQYLQIYGTCSALTTSKACKLQNIHFCLLLNYKC